ncbi:amidohydrolase family protein [Sphingomonas ginsenosidivorax]|uniref:Amidohydrolase family protein n=1 Tax=Sphingomonas ginsenosidivorax TaxID=862135 RepID=A0A5C6UBT7_9SPHN|nr:amidohydrolase family protein [Sphingomonas ginsenosidivorax]TXC70297.1 amidohydrolase family protein [Sphingomonas ginsenosidivorax]
MLIRGAALEDGTVQDVRIAAQRIAAIGPLPPHPGEPVVEARGGLLLPGLHDHHIHLAALAASLTSVACGPPSIADLSGLATVLSRPGEGWLRGVGYHESVAGLLDRAMLDAIVPDRPVRIQHRGGRMWFFNSAALDCLKGPDPAGLDRATGRLFEGDLWLKTTLDGAPPSLAAVGTILARAGVTGVTEISPANDATMARHLVRDHAGRRLPQKVLLAGRATLCAADTGPGVRLGPVKLHLHEADLPRFDTVVAAIHAAHDAGRGVAVHCATEVELVFTLAAFDDAGTVPGDRIEHASVAPDSAVREIARLGLAVVSQPHFIAERGDAYVRDVASDDLPLLYRLRAFLDAGVVLAAGSDAPFGAPEPWASMAAAVTRRTRSGQSLGPSEALTPEQAIDLYLADPDDLGRRRRIAVGAPADLCLLDRDWTQARTDLAAVQVRMTWIDGRLVHDRIDQSPA